MLMIVGNLQPPKHVTDMADNTILKLRQKTPTTKDGVGYNPYFVAFLKDRMDYRDPSPVSDFQLYQHASSPFGPTRWFHAVMCAEPLYAAEQGSMRQTGHS